MPSAVSPRHLAVFRRHPYARRSRSGASVPARSDPAWNRKIDPGKVFDLTLPLEQAGEGYKATDERRAAKVLLTL
jgi:N-acetyl-anhydromuramyl-L-alanine amidase AmpD